MSFKPPFLIAGICIVCGVFLFLQKSLSSISSAEDKSESWAILILDESIDDFSTSKILAKGGIKDIICESSQYVVINDFGGNKQISLVSYNNEVEEFDPRNDGYAQKLLSFFVQNGKRFFFIPIEHNSHNSAIKTEKKLAAILGDVPFQFVVLEQKENSKIFFFFLTAACIFAFLFSHSKRLFVFQIPLLISGGIFGFFSVILAVFFTCLWELLREPFTEFSAVSRYKRDYAGKGYHGFLKRCKPFRLNLCLALLFFILLLLAASAVHFPPFYLALMCLSFMLLYLLSFKVLAATRRKSAHIQFNPVLLMPFRAKTFSLFPILFPFALMSIIALFLPASIPGRGTSPLDSSHFISPEEYYRHVEFQNSFSYIPLNQTAKEYETSGQLDYQNYYLGEDGLIAGSYSDDNFSQSSSRASHLAPPFPLEKLTDFLLKYDKVAIGESTGFSMPLVQPLVHKLKEWITVVFIVAVCLLDFFKSGIASKKIILHNGDKRIAA